MRKATIFTSILLFAVSFVTVQAGFAKSTETDITVYAISKGAKFIGSSMGGAKITIADAETGEILAEGKTAGSTGNTDRIMRQKHQRNRVLSTSDAAKYNTSLWLEEPTRVKITAHGPLDNPEDANSASVTQTILPGKDLTGGDAVRLQIRGFVVDILSPTDNWFQGDSAQLNVKAKVSMMCGCPIKPDGLWDSNDYQIRVAVFEGIEKVNEYDLNYAGKASHFERTITIDRSGCYRIQVYAYDPVTGNTGYESKSCTVEGK